MNLHGDINLSGCISFHEHYRLTGSQYFDRVIILGRRCLAHDLRFCCTHPELRVISISGNGGADAFCALRNGAWANHTCDVLITEADYHELLMDPHNLDRADNALYLPLEDEDVSYLPEGQWVEVVANSDEESI